MTDADFLHQFEKCTLPFKEWTHRAHVKVSYLYLRRHQFDEALDLLRTGIKRYNRANQVSEGPISGYNETTTHAFLHLILATLQAYEQTHPVSTADEFCDMHPQLMTKHALRFFYSPHQRLHTQAKTQFVEPDLTALPRLQRPGL
jgi:hypothetical protein